MSEETESPAARWSPTPYFLHTCVLAAVLTALALVLQRVDLLILATPFIVITAWSLATRPTQAPTVQAPQVSSHSPLEGTGQAWSWQLDAVDPHTEQAITTIDPDPWIRVGAPDGAVITAPADGHVLTTIPWTAHRWGQHSVLPARIHLLSPWAAFCYGPIDSNGIPLTVRPEAPPFRGRASLPHPVGLIGQNRSRRAGDGAEFAEIREFRTGDRLRRISWPITARTGTLHVRTSYAEQDTEVLILLDASVDFGGSIETGSPSSLDVSMRAALSLAGHLLAHGERVGARVMGSTRAERVPASSGSTHYQRLVQRLMTVTCGGVSALPRSGRLSLHASPGALVFVVSPLLNQEAISIIAEIAQRGRQVVVVDALPENPGHDIDPHSLEAVALRLRLLERDQEIRALQERGAPVVSWHGSGSLDHILLQLSRRPPRMVRR